jgi:hypothetical protein
LAARSQQFMAVRTCLLPIRLVAALVVALGDVHPLLPPALGVVGDDLAAGLEHLADGAAAFLGLAQPAPELVGEPEVVVPVVPAERLEARGLGEWLLSWVCMVIVVLVGLLRHVADVVATSLRNLSLSLLDQVGEVLRPCRSCGIRPSVPIVFCTSGRLMARLISSFRRLTISGGVPAGREEAEPARRRVALDRLADGGQVGQVGIALRMGDAQQLQAVRLRPGPPRWCAR